MVLSTILWKTLKLGDGTITDEFLKKFQGGVIFNPKTYIVDFGPLYRALKSEGFSEKVNNMIYRK